MAIENLIPEVWASSILANMHKDLVFGQPGVINTDYEGDIQGQGDTVRINSIGAVNVTDYTKNSTTAITVQTLQDAQTILRIDEAKYFAFQVDDIDRAQQKPKVMGAATQEAAYALSDALDAYIADLDSEIASANFVGSVASPKTGYTAANVYEYLVDLKVLLDTANVPRLGRFAIVPPFVHGYLLKDDRFVKSGAGPDAATLMNGEVGQAAGFRILISNNLNSTSSTAAWRCIAGHPVAWTMAQQLRQVEGYRSPDAFADVMRGLHLYGAKVTRANALACLVISTS